MIQEQNDLLFKVCSKCKKEKLLCEFCNSVSRKDGKNLWCRQCTQKKHKEYYQKNKEKVLAKNAKWFKENPEKRDRYESLWRKKNKERIKKQQQERWIKNKERIIAQRKKYREENRELTTRQWNKCRCKRLKTSPQFKAKTALRCRLRDALKAKGVRKTISAMNLLGCSGEFFKGYIERQFIDGMTWENHGKVWHYDHIQPCDSFDLTDIEQQKECFHYTNIRPLLKEDNQKKSAKKLEEYQLKIM